MFNEEKATELAACILSWGGSMKFIKLLKLIYLADREALDREGHSISTDRWVSMKHGPVPIQTYNLIHQEDDPDRHPVWNQYIENQADYCIGLKKEMGINHLSEAERAIAEDVWKQYGHLPPWGSDGIVAFTHRLPEWENPEENPHGPQATPIPVQRILLALKKSDEEIQAILDLEQTDAWLDRILA